MKNLFLFLIVAFFSSLNLDAQSKKFLLVEEFTNTFCPTCIDKHPEFEENVLKKYEDIKVLHISYHHATPVSEDIFHQFNPEEEGERAAYYQVQGTPSLLLQGGAVPRPVYVEDPILPQENINALLGSESPLEIVVKEIVDGDERTVKVKVNVTGTLPTGNLKLQAVVVEREINYEPPYEGMETRMLNTFRQTLKGWSGSNFVSVSAGNSLTYNFNYTIDPAWQEDQIYVIAFLQNNNNKEIINAGSSWGNNEIVDVKNIDINSNNNIMTVENPVLEQLNISFNQNSLVSSNLATINIFNTLGKIVFKQTLWLEKSMTNQQIDLKTLPKGVYIVNMRFNNVNLTKKILKIGY